MRKCQWIVILALIGCAISFAGCEKIPKMLEPVMPDAEPVEEMMEVPVGPVTVMPDAEPVEEMMEMLVGPVDVLIYTNRSFWITLGDAASAAETTKSLLESKGIQVEITKDDAYVRNWMLQTTGDGNVNVVIFYGVLPASIYGTGNTQPDGSIAENWIETTDGDTILNHADY